MLDDHFLLDHHTRYMFSERNNLIYLLFNKFESPAGTWTWNLPAVWLVESNDESLALIANILFEAVSNVHQPTSRNFKSVKFVYI